MQRSSRLSHALTAALLIMGGVAGCNVVIPAGDTSANQIDDGAGTRLPPVWSVAFDASSTGALSAVWGTAPDDVFVVGGTREKGEVYHYDGSVWSAMKVPPVPLLVWVYGFAPNDIFAVGVGGGIVHFDGVDWTTVESSTTEDLWGVWGRASNDLWIVGGTVGHGDPVILHYDGSTATPVPVPQDDRAATSLFKVWGIGTKTFAVGQRGLILEYENNKWFQVAAGPSADEDFVALWGTSERNIVAVGGRSGARIAHYDGASWTTHAPAGIPGLNAICMTEANEAVVGGVNGYLGSYDPFTSVLTDAAPLTDLPVHAAWADGAGRYYAVGGRFADPYEGVAFVRTFGLPGFDPVAPRNLPPECVVEADCSVGRVCSDDKCSAAPGCSGADTDADGWLDSCDNCIAVVNPTQADDDDDGVGEACDRCAGSDDTVDTDADGTPDGCDVCADGDDTIDTDADGIPDDCDNCVNKSNPQQSDSDSDGVGDVCDVSPNGERPGGGAPGACDVCPSEPNCTDTDGDGVPDACDPCPLDDPDDSDSDGVCESNDVCPGFDDTVDSDLDSVPDGCDTCTGFDDALDDDGDGVANGCDLCEGFDDTIDSDGNGVPDGCCVAQPDCFLAENCDGTYCAPAIPDIELGRANPYVRVAEGGDVTLVRGFQGFGELYLSYRTIGFTPGGTATVFLHLSLVEDATPVYDNPNGSLMAFTEINSGTNEGANDLWLIFEDPSPFFGKLANLTLTIVDTADPTISASLAQTVLIVNPGGP